MSSTKELCQCGHEKNVHGPATAICHVKGGCHCTSFVLWESRSSRFTQPVDEREKACQIAIEAAWKAFGSSAGAYGFMFDAGYAARDEEVERLNVATGRAIHESHNAVTDYKRRLLAKLDELEFPMTHGGTIASTHVDVISIEYAKKIVEQL